MPAVIAHDESGAGILDRPGRREAASCPSDFGQQTWPPFVALEKDRSTHAAG